MGDFEVPSAQTWARIAHNRTWIAAFAKGAFYGLVLSVLMVGGVGCVTNDGGPPDVVYGD